MKNVTLASVTKADIEEFGSASGLYKGFDVAVYKTCYGYEANIWVMTEDDSDAHVSIGLVCGDTLAEVKANARELINDLDETAKEIVAMWETYGFDRGVLNIDELKEFMAETRAASLETEKEFRAISKKVYSSVRDAEEALEEEEEEEELTEEEEAQEAAAQAEADQWEPVEHFQEEESVLVKTRSAISRAFSGMWKKAKKAKKTDELKTSGIDNAKLWNRLLWELDGESEFWSDMVLVQAEGSLRNVNVREMTVDQYDPASGTFKVNGVKCQRAAWTKAVNNHFREEYLEALKEHLETRYTTPRQQAIIALAETPEKLLKALRLEETPEIAAIRETLVTTERYQAEYKRVMEADTSIGHECQFSGKVKAILDRRHAEALERRRGGSDGYLFPALELGANRNTQDAPVTRQSALRSLKKVWQRVAVWALKKGGKLAQAAEEIRFGLHSLRKSLVKVMFNNGATLEELSARLGHADEKMVFNYINNSKATQSRKVREHSSRFQELGFMLG